MRTIKSLSLIAWIAAWIGCGPTQHTGTTPQTCNLPNKVYWVIESSDAGTCGFSYSQCGADKRDAITRAQGLHPMVHVACDASLVNAAQLCAPGSPTSTLPQACFQ